MKRWTILLALSASACGGGAPVPATPEGRGKAVFASYNCLQCHRVGHAGGKVGPDLTMTGFHKNAEFLDLWLKNPRAWQKSTLMPNFSFNDAQRRDLAAYLASLKGQAWGEQKPWAGIQDPIKRGAAIYLRAGCVTCHGKSGAGGMHNNNVPGNQVPSLLKAAEGFSKAELVAKISKGVADPVKSDPAGPAPHLKMPAWGQALSVAEIESVADYLLAVSAPNSSESW